jgi:hypothetical protein
MEQTQMLEYIKALGQPDRLRVIGVLTQSSASIQQVATALNIPFPEALNHLVFLEQIGAVRIAAEQDGLYELDTAKLGHVARRQFEGQQQRYEPAAGLDEKSRKVLKAYLNADGTIRPLPLQPGKLQVILNYLLDSFSPQVIYTEKEVNAILRRDLIDRGMLQRKSDGSQYWRPV